MTGYPPFPIDGRLRDTVEEIYRLFAAPCPPAIESCPCCTDGKEVDVLLATPLRALSVDMLWSYAWSAFLTIGGERDFRYFLPRILELAVSDPGGFCNPEVVLGKLRLANWRCWPADERKAVEALIHGWFERAIARDVADWDGYAPMQEAEGVLCGAAIAGLPLERFLARLGEPDARPLLEELKARRPGGLSGFWEQAPEGFRALSAMLAQGRAGAGA